jgi:hypothetical protein
MSTTNRGISTGRPELDAQINALLDEASVEHDRDLMLEVMVSALSMADATSSRLDLKIASAALREIRSAFRTFAPYRGRPKITMFGSARTSPNHELYELARDCAQRLSSQGWMVVTGAGPGIMAAGLEGAGRNNAMGVNIRLPFESGANEFIEGDPKLVEMKYFFTRKLALVKESDGFVVMPGGFGTLDEAFELLTLLQTGKAEPAPIVLLDTPNGTFWRAWERFVNDAVVDGNYVSAEDHSLYKITSDVDEAANEILGFYRNYHSRRWVGNRLVMRLRVDPSDDELQGLTEKFSASLVEGTIARSAPLAAEVSSDDHVELPRIVMKFDRRRQGHLRMLIDAVNALPSALHQAPRPVHYTTPADI